MTDQHLAAIKYQLTPLNFSGEVKLISELKGGVSNYHHFRDKNVLQVIDNGIADYNRAYLLQRTRNSKFTIGLAMVNETDIPNKALKDGDQFILGNKLVKEIEFDGKKDESYTLYKYLSVYTSRDLIRERIIHRTLQGR